MNKNKDSVIETESINNAGDLHHNPDFLEVNTSRAASKPVVNNQQPDFPVIVPLKFTTNNSYMSISKQGYCVIKNNKLRQLNQFDTDCKQQNSGI